MSATLLRLPQWAAILSMAFWVSAAAAAETLAQSHIPSEASDAGVRQAAISKSQTSLHTHKKLTFGMLDMAKLNEANITQLRAALHNREAEKELFFQHQSRASMAADSRAKWRKKGSFRSWGGAILWKPIDVYLVYVGDWSSKEDSCAPRVMADLIQSLTNPSLSKAPGQTVAKWWDVARQYWQQGPRTQRKYVSSIVRHMPGQHTLHLPSTPRLVSFKYLESAVQKRIPNFYKSGGIVVFLIGRGVNVVDNGTEILCNIACGFHYGNPKLVSHGFAYAVNPMACGTPAACNPNPLYYSNKYGMNPPSPNNCPSADGMASIVLHEIAETASNLVGRIGNSRPGWFCSDFDANCESGDICDLSQLMPFNENCAQALTSQGARGPEYVALSGARTAPNGACYNVQGNNGRKFLIQPLPSTWRIEPGTTDTLACVMQP